MGLKEGYLIQLEVLMKVTLIVFCRFLCIKNW